MTVVLFTDGGARGNPGPAATGVIIYHTYASLDESISRSKCSDWSNRVKELSTHLGETTNNVAEWAAVLEGLTWIKDNHSKEDVVGFLDSQLVQRQILGQYKVKDLKLKEYKKQVDTLLKGTKFQFVHIERAYNKDADALVNKTLDEYSAT